jgi:hypothetical protein
MIVQWWSILKAKNMKMRKNELPNLTILEKSIIYNRIVKIM